MNPYSLKTSTNIANEYDQTLVPKAEKTSQKHFYCFQSAIKSMIVGY